MKASEADKALIKDVTDKLAKIGGWAIHERIPGKNIVATADGVILDVFAINGGVFAQRLEIIKVTDSLDQVMTWAAEARFVIEP